MTAEPEKKSLDAIKARLDEIVEIVDCEDCSLEDVLSLYEEAVGLSLEATQNLNEDIA